MVELICGEILRKNVRSNDTRYKDYSYLWMTCSLDGNIIDTECNESDMLYMSHEYTVYNWCLLQYNGMQSYETYVDEYVSNINRLYEINYMYGSLGCIKLSEIYFLFFAKHFQDKILSQDWGHPISCVKH